MPDVVIHDLSPEVVAALEQNARESGRTLEAELRVVIERAAAGGAASARVDADREDFWKRAAEVRERFKGRFAGDSTDLIREDRDSDHGRGW
ncbi:MAG: hypothetical protein HYX53_11305 [Chloroflexi bacterium]|nr:hypothetical protein [Chloroflexota bacterium]